LDGFSLFVQDGRLCIVHNSSGVATIGRSRDTLLDGRITVGLEFERAGDGAGTFTFTLNGETAGVASVPREMGASRVGGVDIGRDELAPITDLYDAPFEFTGVIHSVDIRVEPR
jgi:arylsulfatase